MRLIGIVLGVLLLLAGCAGPQANALEAWADEQRATYPGLTFERTIGVAGIDGAMVKITVGSEAEARGFSAAFSEAVDGADKGRFDALISWPLGAGTVTLYESSQQPTPAEAWDWAAQPLPAGATARRVGWFEARTPQVFKGWPRVIEYRTASFAETLAAAPAPEGAALSLFDGPERYTGPFPAAEVANRARELALLEPAATAIVGAEATLKPGTDLVATARALEAHPWWLNLDGARVQTGQIDYELLAEMSARGYRLTLTPSELGLGRLTAEACTELFDTLRTPLTVTLSCGTDQSYASLSGPLADVSHGWGVLSPLLTDFASVEVRPDRLQARLRGVAQADWAATVAPLRSLAWPGPRSVDLVADGVSVRFSSTQTGPATNTVKGTEKETAMVAAWDASAD